MYEQKTKAGTGDVDEFLAQVPDAAKRADSYKLIELMQEVTGEPPVLWGTMIGFGQYHYKYASGHEGYAMMIGFAPRKAEFSLYLMGSAYPENISDRDALLAKLGKHRIGKACLYVKRLSDIDLDVLREMAILSVKTTREAHPEKG